VAKPLEDVRVVDLSHVIAGPLASFYLAQLGAEVIKVEPPQGEVMRGRAGFAAMNAGKRSVAVDIRTTEGAQAVRELAASADVFIENFRPGVVKRHGLGYERIAEVRPDIVYCSVSGYGQQGEWSGRGAYDHVVQALTGMMMQAGADPQAPPLKVGFPVIDVATGVLSALAIVSALRRRDQGGGGQYIDASMVQASLALMYPLASASLTCGREPERVGNRGFSGSPAADTYRCTDGWLATAANTPAQFRVLARALGLEALCEDARALDLEKFNAPNGGFVVARDFEYLAGRLREAFAARSAVAMEAALNAAGVPAARVRGLGEFLQEASGRTTFPVFEFEEKNQKVRTPGLGFLFGEDAGQAGGGAPELGEANAELLGKR